MELTIKSGKFWVLENKSDEKNIERYVYDDEKSAIMRLKELMKTIETDKLFLSTVDVIGKDWQIVGVSWSVIAIGIVRSVENDESNKVE